MQIKNGDRSKTGYTYSIPWFGTTATYNKKQLFYDAVGFLAGSSAADTDQPRQPAAQKPYRRRHRHGRSLIIVIGPK